MFGDLGKWRAFLIRAVLAGTGAVFILEEPWRPPEPRDVVPRGDLAPVEETTIALFEATRNSVVSITTEERVLNPWSRRAVDVPRGTGSGFVWDDRGHIVTNNHVISGASGARVRLADGRVLGVEPGSPAASAGLRAAQQDASGRLVPGDIIVGIGERDIAASADLSDALDA